MREMFLEWDERKLYAVSYMNSYNYIDDDNYTYHTAYIEDEKVMNGKELLDFILNILVKEKEKLHTISCVDKMIYINALMWNGLGNEYRIKINEIKER